VLYGPDVRDGGSPGGVSAKRTMLNRGGGGGPKNQFLMGCL